MFEVKDLSIHTVWLEQLATPKMYRDVNSQTDHAILLDHRVTYSARRFQMEVKSFTYSDTHGAILVTPYNSVKQAHRINCSFPCLYFTELSRIKCLASALDTAISTLYGTKFVLGDYPPIEGAQMCMEDTIREAISVHLTEALSGEALKNYVERNPKVNHLITLNSDLFPKADV